MTIPELGTITATHPPIIVLTSNRTRDLHDAVKRRCLYHWIDYPTPQREVEIVRRRVKGASETLAVQVADAVSRMRDSDVQKPPGIAEAIDWLAALSLLGIERLDAAAVDRTLGSVLKYDEDQEVIRAAGLEQLVRAVADGVRRSRRSTSTCRRSPALGQRLREAGVPVTPERSAAFARALTLVRPRAAGGCTGPPARCSSPTAPTSRPSTRSSARVFGERAASPESGRRADGARRPAPRTSDRPATTRARECGGGAAVATREREPRSTGRGRRAAGDGERRGAPASKRFDALEPDELAQLYRLMSRSSWPPRCGARAATSAAPRPPRSTCGGPCARACAPAASRSGSLAGAGASSAAGS